MPLSPSFFCKGLGFFAQVSDCLTGKSGKEKRWVNAIWPASLPQTTKWSVKPSSKEESNHSLIAKKALKGCWWWSRGFANTPLGVGTYQKHEKCEMLPALRGVLKSLLILGLSENAGFRNQEVTWASIAERSWKHIKDRNHKWIGFIINYLLSTSLLILYFLGL